MAQSHYCCNQPVVEFPGPVCANASSILLNCNMIEGKIYCCGIKDKRETPGNLTSVVCEKRNFKNETKETHKNKTHRLTHSQSCKRCVRERCAGNGLYCQFNDCQVNSDCYCSQYNLQDTLYLSIKGHWKLVVPVSVTCDMTYYGDVEMNHNQKKRNEDFLDQAITHSINWNQPKITVFSQQVNGTIILVNKNTYSMEIGMTRVNQDIIIPDHWLISPEPIIVRLYQYLSLLETKSLDVEVLTGCEQPLTCTLCLKKFNCQEWYWQMIVILIIIVLLVITVMLIYMIIKFSINCAAMLNPSPIIQLNPLTTLLLCLKLVGASNENVVNTDINIITLMIPTFLLFKVIYNIKLKKKNLKDNEGSFNMYGNEMIDKVAQESGEDNKVMNVEDLIKIYKGELISRIFVRIFNDEIKEVERETKDNQVKGQFKNFLFGWNLDREVDNYEEYNLNESIENDEPRVLNLKDKEGSFNMYGNEMISYIMFFLYLVVESQNFSPNIFPTRAPTSVGSVIPLPQKCDASVQITSSEMLCLRNLTAETCTMTSQVLASLPFPGSTICYVVINSNDDAVLGHIEVGYIKSEISAQLILQYWTSKWTMINCVNTDCSNSNLCDGDQNCGIFNNLPSSSSDWITCYGSCGGLCAQFPGQSSCQSSCGCAGCGCFFCSDACTYGRWSLNPDISSIHSVSSIGNFFRYPTLQICYVDTLGTRTCNIQRVESSSGTAFSDDFFVTVLGSLAAGTIQPPKLSVLKRRSDSKSFFATVCDTNVPCLSGIGDIQADSQGALLNPTNSSFAFVPNMFSVSIQGHSLSFTGPNSGLQTQYSTLIPMPVFANSINWNIDSNGNLVGAELNPGVLLIAIDAVNLSFTRIINEVCPKLEMISVNGRYSNS